MHDFGYLVPRSTTELERMLADTRGMILAGGTDLILFMETGRLQPKTVIDISRLNELHYMRGDARSIRIGPLVTHSELVESPLLHEWAPILPMAAATIGAVQIRNRGTIGGNLGTASPAGDLIPALMVLEATLTLRSVDNERQCRLEDFFFGPGRTVLQPDEYVAEIAFPTPRLSARGVYVKAGRRKAQALSLVSVGVQLDGNESVEHVRIALGAVAPTVIRARAAEEVVQGQRLTDEVCRQAAAVAAEQASPIDDIRASAAYRRTLVQVWVRRALEACR